MTDYTEADAAAGLLDRIDKLASADPAVLRIVRSVLADRDQLRADLAAARAELDAAQRIGRMLAAACTEAEGVKEQLAEARAERDAIHERESAWLKWADDLAELVDPLHGEGVYGSESLREIIGNATRLAGPHLKPPAEGDR